MAVINLDIDGVIRDFWSMAISIASKEYDIDKNKLKIDSPVIRDMILKFPKNLFFDSLPYPGTIEMVKELEKYHNIIITSHQGTMGGILYSNLWLDKYGLTKDRIFVDRPEQKKDVPGDIIIDDNPAVIEACKYVKETILIKGMYSNKGMTFEEAVKLLTGRYVMEKTSEVVQGLGPWKI